VNVTSLVQMYIQHVAVERPFIEADKIISIPKLIKLQERDIPIMSEIITLLNNALVGIYNESDDPILNEEIEDVFERMVELIPRKALGLGDFSETKKN